MTSILNIICERDADDTGSGKPAVYSCTLQVVDTAYIGSSGTWTTAGPSPTKIFSTRSGVWLKVGNDASLNSDDGDLTKRIVMEGVDLASGFLKGDGLFGGFVVRWRRS